MLPTDKKPEVPPGPDKDEAQAEKFSERTLWSLNNAATEALKLLKPAPQQACGLGVGRMFGRLVHRARPEPVAVIDGIEGIFDVELLRPLNHTPSGDTLLVFDRPAAASD